MRRLVSIAVLALLGCGAEEGEVVQAPNRYKACNELLPCADGLECRGGICLPPLSDPTPIGDNTTDTVAAEPSDVATGVDAADDVGDPGTPDVPAVADVGDPPVPDVVDVSDPPVPDVVEVPDVPAQPDECTQAGFPAECPQSPEFLYCLYAESTKNLVCQGEGGGLRFYGEACATNEECQLPYGCHFGVCTQYCEFAVPACPGTATCVSIGHPKFGACKQPPQ